MTTTIPGTGTSVPQPITIPSDRSREDRIYRGVARSAGFTSFVILFLIGFFLLYRGLPVISKEGLHYFTQSGYDSGKSGTFGTLGEMYGTIVVSLIAVIVGVPFAVSMSLFISEYAPVRLRRALVAMIDLGAAIPSILIGVWALHQFMPQVTGTTSWLARHAAFIPFFKTSSPPPYNQSYFIAGLVVGLMVVPIVASVCREVFSLAPPGEKEGALALGATRSQMIRTVILPFGRGGIIGASMLGLGRALGETIAVVVILGGSTLISPHILEHGGSTVAQTIASKFGTGGSLGQADLLMLGFVLFTFTLIVNLAASAIVNRSRSGKGVEL
jgi:phosphate transport system permease protein